MKPKVLKFGGSSVADAGQLAKLRDIVSSDPDNRYVVVSAPGKRFASDSKVTDMLYLCKKQRDSNVRYDDMLDMIIDRYEDNIRDLGLDLDLKPYYAEIRRQIASGCSADYVASRGEFLSAIVTARFLGYDFVDAAGLIFFNSRGRILTDETYKALGEELAKHERAVIPGFYGSVKETGEIHTFSRGGSDITGSLVARAVDASIYENWTDVSGLLMADPRIVRDPKPIDRISYLELRELSYTGATVLHEDAVFPVREAGIPINIRNTNIPDDPGTVIDSDVSPGGKIISGIAGKRDFTVITVYKNMMNKELGFVRRALMVLEDHNINFDHIPTGIDTFSVVIDRKEIDGKLEDVLEEFEARLDPDEINVYEDISLIAVVGRGMQGRVGMSARILNALAARGINLRMLNQGTSEINVIVGVLNTDFEESIRAIYEEFA